VVKGSTLAALVVVAACRHTSSIPAPASALGADIAVLASPALDGREAGSPGADSAAAFLAQLYERLGLRPAFRLRCSSTPTCPESYFQPFDVQRGGAQNVAAVVDGADSVVRAQYVVLGAHYDHLGRSPTFALDRDRGFVIRPGADDNASGAAALLELARRFRERPPRRSLLFVNFDAEELGLLGSREFLINPPISPQAMTFMLNLDMVGRLNKNRLFIEGVRDRTTRALIDSAVIAVGIRPEYIADAGRSDHATFLLDGLDAVGLSTGYHSDYHTAADIAAHLNLVGLERVVDVAEAIVRRIADR